MSSSSSRTLEGRLYYFATGISIMSIGLGLRLMLQGKEGAGDFGVPLELTPRSSIASTWIPLIGLRQFAVGLSGLLLANYGNPQSVAIALVGNVIISFGDAVIIFNSVGKIAKAAPHVVTGSLGSWLAYTIFNA